MAEYCSDVFRMAEDNEDSFRMWQGLVGPYYTPHLSNDGTLSFTNNGSLPNPEAVNIRGPQGAGIRIAGIVESAEGLPASSAGGDIWLVGDSSPYEGYSFTGGEWIDLGPLTVGPAGPPGPQGDDYELTEGDKQEIAEIAEGVLLTELSSTPLGIRYGGTGANDLSGAKENLGIDDIETKLGEWPLGTDAQDVSGAINEMIGEISLQVADIQALKDDLAAEFNPNLTYAKGAYCVYGGQLYICSTAVTTAGSWTGDANWTQVTAGGELTAANAAIEEAAGDIDDLETIVGDGVLTDFTATDLTGAANELKTSISTQDLGSNTLSNIQSALATLGSGMEDNEVKNIKFGISSAEGVFRPTGHIGVIRRTSSTRFVVEVQTISPSYSGCIITGVYDSGTWTWDSTGTTPIAVDKGGTGETTAVDAQIALRGKPWKSFTVPKKNTTEHSTVTFSNGFRGVFMFINANAATSGMYFVYCADASHAPVITTVLAGSSLTLTTSTAQIKIESTAASTCYVMCMTKPFYNAITIT